MKVKNQKILILMFILVLSFDKGFTENNNRFIPIKLPDGFTFARPPEFYGTYEKPGKNGTIYDYINGGGEIYIKHGFREVTHMVLKDSRQNSITLNIFDMGTPGNAAAAFADKAICPEGFIKVNIGTMSKSYRYEPDFLVYFIKGKYLIYLALSNDALAEMLKQFAGEIYKEIIATKTLRH